MLKNQNLLLLTLFVYILFVSCYAKSYEQKPISKIKSVNIEATEVTKTSKVVASDVDVEEKKFKLLKNTSKRKMYLEGKMPLPQNKIDENRARSLIKALSLDEKIGQLLFLGFGGTKMDAEIAGFLKSYKPGAVAFFGRNIKHLGQTMALIRDVRKYDPAGIPMFISVDQEGGKVVRIKRHVDILPSQMALGAAADPDLAFRAGKMIGEELKVMGFNMNLAPVLDVNSNPKNPVIGTRSYSSDPHLVAELGDAYIRGMQEAGMSAVAKHFPGHGDTQSDSHFALPLLKHSRQRLDALELIPFKKVTEKQTVDAIMTAHIALPKVSEAGKLPATLSHKILTGILREDLGFKGIVMTDGLEMAGIVKRYGSGEAAVQAVLAGADMVMVLWFKEKKQEVKQALKDAVLSGRISMQRLEQSVLRIISTKIKRGLFEQKLIELEKASKKLKTYKKSLTREIARRAITLVKNDLNLLPIYKKGVLKKNLRKILVISSEASFIKELKKKHSSIQKIRLPAHPSKRQIHRILEQIKKKSKNVDLVIFGLKEGRSLNIPKQFMKYLSKTSLRSTVKVAVVSFASPYMFAKFPEVDAYLCTFGFRYQSQVAAAMVLLGQLQPTGKLPVTLSLDHSR